MPKRGTVVVEYYQRDDSARTDYPPVVVDLETPLVRNCTLSRTVTGRINARQTDAVTDYALGIPQTT